MCFLCFWQETLGLSGKQKDRISDQSDIQNGQNHEIYPDREIEPARRFLFAHISHLGQCSTAFDGFILVVPQQSEEIKANHVKEEQAKDLQ